MKRIKTPPGAKRLIESLRDLGYECSTAIADLIDNSVSADASEIFVDIHPKDGKIPAYIVIADNGKGIDRRALYEAMRFGSTQEYDSEDLGKYGLGLKTASLSQCRRLTVSSKPRYGKGKRSLRNIVRWDLDRVYEADDWDLLDLDSGDLQPWEKEVLNNSLARAHGTVILWSELGEALPLLSAGDENKRQRFFARLLEEVSSHLRMVFHRFMQQKVQGRRKLTIKVGDLRLTPWDPFCIDEDKTESLSVKSLTVGVPGKEAAGATEKVAVSPFILPREDEYSTREAWKNAAGPRGWNQQQGLYFYRNGRLLQAGGWSYIRSPDEHTKLLRIAVDFPSDLDTAFSINVTKMRARIPADIRDALQTDISKWTQKARAHYDRKARPSGRGTQTPASPSGAVDRRLPHLPLDERA